MSPWPLLLLLVSMSGVFLVVSAQSLGAGGSAQPWEVRVEPGDERAIIPVKRPAGYEDHLLILVKMPDTDVTHVTPNCSVTGANSYRDRVQGSRTSSGCDVVLSNPVKEDEGLYEMRDSRVNGTSIPGSRIELIFGDHPRSGHSKSAGASKVLICAAIFLAVCLPCLL